MNKEERLQAIGLIIGSGIAGYTLALMEWGLNKVILVGLIVIATTYVVKLMYRLVNWIKNIDNDLD